MASKPQGRRSKAGTGTRLWSVFILLLVAITAHACVDEHDPKHADSVSGESFESPDVTGDTWLETTAELLAEDADPTSFESASEDDGSLDGHRKRRHHHHRRHRRGLSPIEALFAAQPSREKAKENLRFLTSVPHMAGTKEDETYARWMKKEFLKLGADSSWLEPFDAFLSYPRQKPRLALICDKNESKVEFEAKLSEDILESDATSDTWFRNNTFNGYSPSGSVKGKLVYANFGTPDDFAVLEKFNVSVAGRIVLMRYGKCFRGLKAMNAQQRGAIGAIIFSDPHEDGYSVGEAYPKGPWRPASSVQRGSVQFNSLCAGDPRRASSNDTYEKCGYQPRELYPKIPVLPIAYEDALPLLRSLRGPYSPPEFVGTLQVAYKLGPSEPFALLETRNRYAVEKIWNAFAIFKGPHFGTRRDRPLVIGNHRDAWVFGAVDPNSGTSVMLEVARGFGVLKKMGWKPRRSIIFASWSGEELGLLGSTAWGEKHMNGFLKKAVAYLNVDIGVSGHRFQLETTASLARYIAEVLSDIPDPEIKGKSVLSVRWSNRDFYPLGTGSDYTVFIHHLGIPSADMRFTAESGTGAATSYGVYHSIYDSFSWMEQFGDPTFAFHEKMAVIWGVCALRMADALVLPFDHITQAKLIFKYIQEVRPMVPDERAYRGMVLAAHKLFEAAVTVEKDKAKKLDVFHYAIDSTLNDRLAFAERKFLHRSGLPLRKWFKHVLQAPDLYLGYAAQVLPGIVQAFRDQNNHALANQQAIIFATRVLAVAEHLQGRNKWLLDDDNDDEGFVDADATIDIQ